MRIFFKPIYIQAGHTIEETRITQPTNYVNFKLPTPRSTQFISLMLVNVTRAFTICELTVYGDCVEGEFGHYCERQCHCGGIPCDSTGICPSKVCLPGYEGPTCDTVCGDQCLVTCGHCSGSDICERETGRCPDQCASGYKGDTCKQECDIGTYGDDCADTCGHCKDETSCVNTNGSCPTGCMAGYQGDTCKPECAMGTYGVDCAETCGHCKDETSCVNTDGSCPTGCMAGYQSDTCKTEFDMGTHGVDCAETCGHCKDETFCVNTNGSCPTGCMAGYQGDTCKTKCDMGRYGVDCVETCGHCKDKTSCVNTNGSCPTGCMAGYQGDTCKTETLQEPETKDPLFLIVSGWIFAGITLLASAGFFMKMRMRRFKQNQTSTDTGIYDMPRASHNEEKSQYENPALNA